MREIKSQSLYYAILIVDRYQAIYGREYYYIGIVSDKLVYLNLENVSLGITVDESKAYLFTRGQKPTVKKIVAKQHLKLMTNHHDYPFINCEVWVEFYSSQAKWVIDAHDNVKRWPNFLVPIEKTGWPLL